LCLTIVTCDFYCASGFHPREASNMNFLPFFFDILFGNPYPSYFWICISHRRNNACIKVALVPCGNFGSDMALVYSFVRKHWLTNNIPYSKYMGNISTHLLINGDKSTLINGYPGLFGSNVFTIGYPTDRLQNQIVALLFFRRFIAFELSP